jgi:hypothetical protein
LEREVVIGAGGFIRRSPGCAAADAPRTAQHAPLFLVHRLSPSSPWAAAAMAQPGQTQYNTFPQYQAQGYAAPTGYATPTGYSPTNEPYTAPYGFGASYTFNDSQPGTQPAASQSTELPDSTSVDATVATQAIERLVAAQLRVEGFRKADSIAMKRLELEVIACAYAVVLTVGS